MSNISNLEPKALWSNFAKLNAVPRPSKKEERVIAFMMEFGQNLGFETIQDEVGNVIIRKPASKGMEDKTKLVFQSHLDMVHQKNADTVFDFDTEGIKMYIDGDWVKAEGTTLGADNGIGVATIMALLESTDIDHPAFDALFTIDEETGMTGAMGLKGGLLEGEILLNLDTEDDDELTIGCAGGIDVTVSGAYTMEAFEGGFAGFKLTVKGLKGGHSGMDIHKGRGNANKIINRILWKAQKSVQMAISSINGGSLRNAIPRESFAQIGVAQGNVDAFQTLVANLTVDLLSEYKTTDPNLQINIEPIEGLNEFMDRASMVDLLNSIYACPNGIYRMSPDVDGLVQTSSNLARVEVANGQSTVMCLTRGSVDTEKMDMADAIKACFEMSRMKVVMDGDYPGWAPKPDAAIIQVMADIYRDIFDGEPNVNACHAGLECGILGQNYPDMEMISFGPNIRGAHSPDERVQISSVQKYWSLLMQTLKSI